MLRVLSAFGLHLLLSCCLSLSCVFRLHVQERVNRAERQFRCLPLHHQELLSQFLPNLDKIRHCIDHNQDVLQAIVRNCVHMFENMEYGEYVSLFSLSLKIDPSSLYLRTSLAIAFLRKFARFSSPVVQ